MNTQHTLLSLMCYMFAILSSCNTAQTELLSPDKDLKINIKTVQDEIQFSLRYNDENILNYSPIGLNAEGTDLNRNVKIRKINKTSHDSDWKTVNGKQQSVRNQYNEYELVCQTVSEKPLDFSILYRCYNDGFAYRFVFPEQENYAKLTITGENTKLDFTENYTYWATNGENHNVGPLDRATQPTNRLLPPVVMKTKHTQIYLSIQEAEIMRYAPFVLSAKDERNTMTFTVTPTNDVLPVKTSWRSFIIGNRAGDLVESNLLVNLNEPCKIDDTSWIKPGKSLWDWRVWGYKTDDGFEYGLNTVSHKRLIDFAAANNIQYLLIDADWYGPEFSEESNPANAREGIDIEQCMTYAKEKDIGIILYLNDVGAKKFGLETVLKQFSEWGAVGVKYGFMKFDKLEDKVRHTREVIELCAKYKLMVNFHDGPIAPSGDRRTWPNVVTREFCHAQADAKRSYYPETGVNQAFINMIAGPLDVTNGWFDLNNAMQSRVRVFEDIPGTLVAEVAKLIVYYSGWIVLPDAPEAYLKYDDLFDCVRKIPAQYDSFKVLDGDIDHFICVARQAGDDWFVGTLTNREQREVEIDFSFLPPGIQYNAVLYEDAPESHFLTNKEVYQIEQKTINADTKLTIHMAAGGGHAIYLKKK